MIGPEEKVLRKEDLRPRVLSFADINLYDNLAESRVPRKEDLLQMFVDEEIRAVIGIFESRFTLPVRDVYIREIGLCKDLIHYKLMIAEGGQVFQDAQRRIIISILAERFPTLDTDEFLRIYLGEGGEGIILPAQVEKAIDGLCDENVPLPGNPTGNSYLAGMIFRFAQDLGVSGDSVFMNHIVHGETAGLLGLLEDVGVQRDLDREVVYHIAREGLRVKGWAKMLRINTDTAESSGQRVRQHYRSFSRLIEENFSETSVDYFLVRYFGFDLAPPLLPPEEPPVDPAEEPERPSSPEEDKKHWILEDVADKAVEDREVPPAPGMDWEKGVPRFIDLYARGELEDEEADERNNLAGGELKALNDILNSLGVDRRLKGNETWQFLLLKMRIHRYTNGRVEATQVISQYDACLVALRDVVQVAGANAERFMRIYMGLEEAGAEEAEADPRRKQVPEQFTGVLDDLESQGIQALPAEPQGLPYSGCLLEEGVEKAISVSEDTEALSSLLEQYGVIDNNWLETFGATFVAMKGAMYNCAANSAGNRVQILQFYQTTRNGIAGRIESAGTLSGSSVTAIEAADGVMFAMLGIPGGEVQPKADSPTVTTTPPPTDPSGETSPPPPPLGAAAHERMEAARPERGEDVRLTGQARKFISAIAEAIPGIEPQEIYDSYKGLQPGASHTRIVDVGGENYYVCFERPSADKVRELSDIPAGSLHFRVSEAYDHHKSEVKTSHLVVTPAGFILNSDTGDPEVPNSDNAVFFSKFISRVMSNQGQDSGLQRLVTWSYRIHFTQPKAPSPGPAGPRPPVSPEAGEGGETAEIPKVGIELMRALAETSPDISEEDLERRFSSLDPGDSVNVDISFGNYEFTILLRRPTETELEDMRDIPEGSFYYAIESSFKGDFRYSFFAISEEYGVYDSLIGRQDYQASDNCGAYTLFEYQLSVATNKRYESLSQWTRRLRWGTAPSGPAGGGPGDTPPHGPEAPHEGETNDLAERINRLPPMVRMCLNALVQTPSFRPAIENFLEEGVFGEDDAGYIVFKYGATCYVMKLRFSDSEGIRSFSVYITKDDPKVDEFFSREVDPDTGAVGSLGEKAKTILEDFRTLLNMQRDNPDRNVIFNQDTARGMIEWVNVILGEGSVEVTISSPGSGPTGEPGEAGPDGLPPEEPRGEETTTGAEAETEAAAAAELPDVVDELLGIFSTGERNVREEFTQLPEVDPANAERGHLLYLATLSGMALRVGRVEGDRILLELEVEGNTCAIVAGSDVVEFPQGHTAQTKAVFDRLKGAVTTIAKGHVQSSVLVKAHAQTLQGWIDKLVWIEVLEAGDTLLTTEYRGEIPELVSNFMQIVAGESIGEVEARLRRGDKLDISYGFVASGMYSRKYFGVSIQAFQNGNGVAFRVAYRADVRSSEDRYSSVKDNYRCVIDIYADQEIALHLPHHFEGIISIWSMKFDWIYLIRGIRERSERNLTCPEDIAERLQRWLDGCISSHFIFEFLRINEKLQVYREQRDDPVRDDVEWDQTVRIEDNVRVFIARTNYYDIRLHIQDRARDQDLYLIVRQDRTVELDPDFGEDSATVAEARGVVAALSDSLHSIAQGEVEDRAIDAERANYLVEWFQQLRWGGEASELGTGKREPGTAIVRVDASRIPQPRFEDAMQLLADRQANEEAMRDLYRQLTQVAEGPLLLAPGAETGRFENVPQPVASLIEAVLTGVQERETIANFESFESTEEATSASVLLIRGNHPIHVMLSRNVDRSFMVHFHLLSGVDSGGFNVKLPISQEGEIEYESVSGWRDHLREDLAELSAQLTEVASRPGLDSVVRYTSLNAWVSGVSQGMDRCVTERQRQLDEASIGLPEFTAELLQSIGDTWYFDQYTGLTELPKEVHLTERDISWIYLAYTGNYRMYISRVTDDGLRIQICRNNWGQEGETLANVIVRNDRTVVQDPSFPRGDMQEVRETFNRFIEEVEPTDASSMRGLSTEALRAWYASLVWSQEDEEEDDDRRGSGAGPSRGEGESRGIFESDGVATCEHFHPVDDGHDKFGNTLEHLTANIEGEERETDLLVSESGREMIEGRDGFIEWVDRSMRTLQTGDTHRIDYTNGYKASLEKTELEGSQSDLYRLEVDDKKYLVKVPKTDVSFAFDDEKTGQPFWNEMLQMQHLDADLGATFSGWNYGLQKYMFATSSVCCVEMVEGVEPEQQALAPTIKRLSVRLVDYLDAKGDDPLWRSVSPDTWSLVGHRIQTQNFIQEKGTGRYILVDPFVSSDDPDVVAGLRNYYRKRLEMAISQTGLSVDEPEYTVHPVVVNLLNRLNVFASLRKKLGVERIDEDIFQTRDSFQIRCIALTLTRGVNGDFTLQFLDFGGNSCFLVVEKSGKLKRLDPDPKSGELKPVPVIDYKAEVFFGSRSVEMEMNTLREFRKLMRRSVIILRNNPVEVMLIEYISGWFDDELVSLSQE